MKKHSRPQFKGLVHFNLIFGISTLCFLLAFEPFLAQSAEPPSSGQTDPSQSDATTENLHEQINDLESQIQKLRAQSLELQEKTRLKLRAQIDLLQKQRDSLVPRIERLRDNSETAWQDIKENIQKAIEELKRSVDVMEK